ncbi:SEC-C domain-containing protein [Sulfurimonas sp. SAG-AH-194-I05]|nr:YchJ family metal-binding protein [Sulfurimonas sp. SAG-AH-194-I05]MDF1874469.1 SEC-C domain-containing protein [Sulfurimonas sp. SAG-AH-194-I05]
MKTHNKTPEELMRSRYDAFVKEDWEYIANTSTSQNLKELKDAVPLRWLKLDVLNAYDNIVEFKAYYVLNSITEVLHEKSTFIKEDNMWKYHKGELFPSKIQRNEVCPCGSGKKFKKCCS